MSGQRPGGLGQEHELVDGQRRFPAPRLRRPCPRRRRCRRGRGRPARRGRPSRGAGSARSGRRGRGRRASRARGGRAPARRAGGSPRPPGAGLERLRLGADGRDRVPVGKALGQAARGLAHVRAESRCVPPAPTCSAALGEIAWTIETAARLRGLRGLDVHDLVLQGAARGRDLDGLALLAAQDRPADRRLVRELVLGGVRLGRADDRVLDRLLRVDVAERARSCRR